VDGNKVVDSCKQVNEHLGSITGRTFFNLPRVSFLKVISVP
jgi:hypothetical protein